jgi:rod shape-determining protein MreD
MSGFQSGRPLDSWRWLVMPALIALVATLLTDIPLRIWGTRLPQPVYLLVLAFSWAVIRPSLLPPFVLLLLGLYLDLFEGGAVGLWPTCILMAYGFVLMTRPMMTGQSRVVMWGWYAAACLLAFTAAYLLSMLDALSTPNLLATFWQWLATALLYPFAHSLIERFEDADVRFR